MVNLTTLQLFGLASFFNLTAFAAVLKEQLASVPAGWTATGVPSESTTLVLQIALAQQNLDQLESKLSSVSTPSSAFYGKYLDIDGVNAIFAPSAASTAAVKSWLTSNKVTNYTTQGDSIWFQTTVANANSMLNTTFSTYSDSTGTTKLRTLQYSLPASIAPHVDLVSPTTYFGKTKAMRAITAPRTENLVQRALPAVCNTSIIYDDYAYASFAPSCLNTVYNVHYTPSASSGSKIAFGSFLNQSASFADLALFEKAFNYPVTNFSVVLVNPQDGATDLPQPPDPANDGEANLDSQVIASLTHPLPVTEFITAGSPPYFPDPVEPAGTPNENEPYLPYYEYLLSLSSKDLPQVVSNSYGDEEQTVPEAYAVRVCNLIGLLGLRGVTVIHSSGDEGVGASCVSTQTGAPQFNPIFPATCPYVTAIGGTVDLASPQAWVGSSGGFSYYFKRPWYQEIAIGTYLSKYISASTKKYYGSYVDFTGRGFPDVSAHSVHPDYSVYQTGELTPSGGTSAAAPVTASLIALLNDARLRVGQPTLGFLNPWIYLYGFQGFVDVTTGQTDGCDGDDTQTGAATPGAAVIPGSHWNATVGWDPTTGFGVPNFGKLLSLLELPSH